MELWRCGCLDMWMWRCVEWRCVDVEMEMCRSGDVDVEM